MTAPVLTLAQPTVHQDAVEMLEYYLEEAKAGRITSVGVVARRTGGTYSTGYSKSESRAEDAGMLLTLAVRRLGFVEAE